MISIEQVMERYPIAPMVAAAYHGSFGKAIPWHILGEVESEVHLRLSNHGPFTAYKPAQSWLGKVVRSSIAEWWRRRQATECLSYHAPTSANAEADASDIGEAHEDKNFSEFFGYTPHQNAEDRIALVQLLKGIAKAAGTGVTKQRVVAETAMKMVKMIEDGSVADVVPRTHGWAIPGVTPSQLVRLKEWVQRYHKASDWF